MAEGRRDHDGGIRGLYGLVDEHREAIDYDLLTLGLDLNDLGTQRLDWRRLRAVVTYLPSTSALARSAHGEKAGWTVAEHLLAATVDALNAANWQRGGGKGRRPRPVPRPGDKNRRTLGSAKMTIERAGEFFDRINRPADEQQCEVEGCDRTDIHARQMCAMHYQRWWRQTRGSQ